MIITQAVWSKVHIKWDQPLPTRRFDHKKQEMVDDPTEEESYENVRLYYECAFEEKGVYTLRLSYGKNGNLLLSRAKLLSMTPWSAKFEAYWWAAGETKETKKHYRNWRRKHKQKKSSDHNFDVLVRGEIICEF